MGNFLNKIIKISLLSKVVLKKADRQWAFNILGKKKEREMESGGWREIGVVKKAMSKFSLKDFNPLMIAPVKFSVVEKIHNFSSSPPFFSPRRRIRDWIGALSNLRKPLFYFALRNPNIINLLPQMREIPISSTKPKRELSISVPSLFSSQYVEEDVFSSLLKSLRKQLGF
jgi:hypothetical protein